MTFTAKQIKIATQMIEDAARRALTANETPDAFELSDRGADYLASVTDAAYADCSDAALEIAYRVAK